MADAVCVPRVCRVCAVCVLCVRQALLLYPVQSVNIKRRQVRDRGVCITFFFGGSHSPFFFFV